MISFVSTLFSRLYSQRDYDRTRRAPLPLPTGKSASYLDPMDRRDIVARMVKARANVPVVESIHSFLVSRAIGKGLVPTYTSDDPDKNLKINALIRTWMRNKRACDVSAKNNLFGIQKGWCKALLINGEAYSLHRKKGVFGYALQAINPESVTGGTVAEFKNAGFPAHRVYDGIALDEDGGELAYRLQNGAIVAASSAMHIFDASEANSYKGLPAGFTSVNKALDLHEIDADAVGSAKAQARVGWFRKKNKPAAGNKSMLAGIAPAASNSDSAAALTTSLQNILGGGGAIVDVAHGEELVPFAANNPSDRTMGMLSALDRKVVLAYGIAPDMVLDPGKIGGAATRGAQSQADLVIYALQEPIREATREAVIRFLLACLSEGLLDASDLPEGFEDFVRVQLPPTVSVDFGRDTKASLDLLAQGQETEESLQNEQGRDWKDVQLQRVLEEKHLIELCEKYGVPYSNIRAPKAGAAAPAPTEQKPQNGQ